MKTIYIISIILFILICDIVNLKLHEINNKKNK